MRSNGADVPMSSIVYDVLPSVVFKVSLRGPFTLPREEYLPSCPCEDDGPKGCQETQV